MGETIIIAAINRGSQGEELGTLDFLKGVSNKNKTNNIYTIIFTIICLIFKSGIFLFTCM